MNRETEASDPRGMVQSLLMKAMRTELTALGHRLSIPVVYIKGAWSEPVLWGGFGKRRVSDVDVLVPDRAFERYAEALPTIGYRRKVFEGRQSVNDVSKEWTFEPVNGGGLTIDLHRALANPGFGFDSARAIARSVYWDSVDGPVLSLCPEDQVVYCAVHAANHFLAFDDRHPRDVVKMLERVEVDWAQIERDVARGGLSVSHRAQPYSRQPPTQTDMVRRRFVSWTFDTSTGVVPGMKRLCGEAVLGGDLSIPLRSGLTYLRARLNSRE